MSVIAPSPNSCASRLAIAIAAVFALSTAETARAITWTVDTCADNNSGSTSTHKGSLRFASAKAASGDTIDLSGLACTSATITLTLGAIPIAVDDLKITAASDHRATIDGDNNDRVFRHTGSGSLSLYYLDITKGKYQASYARGGCISSRGDVTLGSSTLTQCTALQTGTPAVALAEGGGVFAQGEIALIGSTVSADVAYAAGKNPNVNGGGLFAQGGLDIKYSTLSGNYAVATYAGSPNAHGGGAETYGGVYLLGSTIDTNYASFAGGALMAVSPTATVTIINSTLSNNRSTEGAGLWGAGPSSVFNSTIAFNDAVTVGGGIYVVSGSADLTSTIVADNTSGFSGDGDIYVHSGASLSGTASLVRQANVVLPVGTFSLDPMLVRLANHGGNTRTLALLPGSPAIAQGSNPRTLKHDQRGKGFARETSGTTDIGAYQRDADDDEIFYNGFEATGG